MSFIFKPYIKTNIQHILMCMYNTSFISVHIAILLTFYYANFSILQKY